MRKWTRFSALVPVLVLVVSATALSMKGKLATLPLTRAAAEMPAETSSDRHPVAMDVNLFRNIAHQVNPVVVAIMTRARVDVPAMADDSPLDWLLRGPSAQMRHRLQRGLGSGFIISREGDILTNNHVVAGADVIEVALFGDEDNLHRARIVGRDPLSDSALIRLEQAPGDLPVARLGDSDALEPGDWVMAIGNPFQLGHTVTVGVVSYIGRPFEVQEGRWQKMIQTDASINPGNSGGPLLNVNGEIVGVNAAILGAGSGGNIGIGFAVPINSVKDLLPRLRTGKVAHGRIGVQLRNAPITQDEAKALGLGTRTGALVVSVEPGSPADRAGLRAGDVIVAVNGTAVKNADDLVPRVASIAPGSKAALTVVRDGREQTLGVTVEELVLEGERGATQQPNEQTPFGLQLGEITPSIASQLRLPREVQGAVVYAVEPDSPADRAGLMEGDVVLSINRQPVRSRADTRRLLQQLGAAQPAFLLIWRDGNVILMQLRRDS